MCCRLVVATPVAWLPICSQASGPAGSASKLVTSSRNLSLNVLKSVTRSQFLLPVAAISKVSSSSPSGQNVLAMATSDQIIARQSVIIFGPLALVSTLSALAPLQSKPIISDNLLPFPKAKPLRLKASALGTIRTICPEEMSSRERARLHDLSETPMGGSKLMR
jgi:hypothetical protein